MYSVDLVEFGLVGSIAEDRLSSAMYSIVCNVFHRFGRVWFRCILFGTCFSLVKIWFGLQCIVTSVMYSVDMVVFGLVWSCLVLLFSLCMI